MTSAEAPVTRVARIASEILGAHVETVQHVDTAGRNSRIYRILSGNQTFALKQYPILHADPRDRLQAELKALRFMEHHHIDTVPRVVAAHPGERLLLLTWVDGEPVKTITKEDIDAAGAFLTTIHELRHNAEAQHLPLASEACLCGAEIERQIRARLAKLNERSFCEEDLRVLLEGGFASALDKVLPRALSQLSLARVTFDRSLPADHQSLIPADFGFHNSLRQNDGKLAFLDFEYFGWDDPVKLTVDFLLHPGMALESMARQRFLAGAEGRYSNDPTFTGRFRALFPLLGLRWVLVLLNEFLPERWELRVNAGAREDDWDAVKRRQLDRATVLLKRVLEEIQEPY
jgi:hypothetical protein